MKPIALVVLVLLAGCRGSCSGPEEATDNSPPAELTDISLPPEAPDQYACAADDDCVFAPWHYDDAPCCNVGSPYGLVQARAFVEWRDRWQTEACGEVDCAPFLEEHMPMGAPSPPAPCYFEPRCSDGACSDSCGISR